jgi:hypothetical protein
MTPLTHAADATGLSYYRCASTGAFSTLSLFVLCWLGLAIGLPVALSHAFVSIFTLEPAGSLSSLWIGSLSAFVSGGVAGAIIAHCYNLAGRWF